MATTPTAGGTKAVRISTELFFAKVPPSLSTEAVAAVFNKFGSCSVNLFKRWPTARTSKGCGIVTYEESAAATAALEELHGKFMWLESEVPIVVEWMDAAKQKPVPPKPAAAGKPCLQQKYNASNTSQKSHGLSASPCWQQNKEASSLVQQLLGNTLLIPGAQQQHNTAVAAAISDDEQIMVGQGMGYAACYSGNSQFTHTLEGHLASWDMAGAVPVHLLPITAALQAKACTPEGSGGSLNMDPSLLALQKQQQQQQASMAVLPSSHSSVGARMGAAAFGLPAADWGCYDGRHLRHTEEVQQGRIYAAGVHAAPSCSTSQLLIGNSPLVLDTAGVVGSQMQSVLLPEGVLQLSDSWMDSGCLQSPGIVRQQHQQQQQHLDACASFGYPGHAVLPTRALQQSAMFDGVGDGQDSGSLLSASSVMFSAGMTECVNSCNAVGQQVDGAGLFTVPTLQSLSSGVPATKQLMSASPIMLPVSPSSSLPSSFALQQLANRSAPVADALGSLLLDVSPEVVGKIASVMGAIKSISSAQVELVAAEGGLKLRLAGSASQVQSAVSLYNVALAAN